MAAPTISAAQAIGEYLQSPDDLMKIPAFRKKLEKEKASIDIRVKGGVKEQLSVTSESLRNLFSTRDNVQAIRDEMVIVDRMCSDPQNVVSTFDQISRVRQFCLAPLLVILISQSLGIDSPQKLPTNRRYGE
jgi:exocyst complex component 3